jgi:hypothetical protein
VAVVSIEQFSIVSARFWLLICLIDFTDDAEGNVYIPNGDADGFFACGDISESFYEFDPLDNEFEKLPNMPRPRYRHSSAIVGDQVWILGGRDVDDNLIPEVDVSFWYFG